LIGAEKVAANLGLTRGQVSDAMVCRKTFDEWFLESGINPDRFIQDYIPMVERYGRDKNMTSGELTMALRDAAKKFGMDEKFFADRQGPDPEFRAIDWTGREWNLQELMHRYHWGMMKSRMVAPKLNEMMKVVNETLPTPYRAGQNAYVKFALPSQIRRVVTNYAMDVVGIAPELDVKIEKFIGDKLSMVTGGRLGRDQTAGLTNAWISGMYSSFLGLRPGPIIRETMGLFTYIYPIIGEDGLVAGMRRAFTREGLESARRAGLFADSGLPGQTLDVGRGAVGIYKKVSDLFLTPYKKANDIPRTVAFLGSEDKAIRALKSTKTFEEFANRLELDDAQINVYRDMYELGRKDQIPTMFGLDTVDSLAHSFFKGSSPGRNVVGRILGMFGVFPKQYLDFINRDVLMIGRGNSRAINVIRAKRMARYVVNTVATVGVGAEIGIDLHDWVLTHPLSWFVRGGPIIGLGKDAYNLAAGQPWEQAIAKKRLLTQDLPQIVAPVPAFTEGKSLYSMATGNKDFDVPGVLGLKKYQADQWSAGAPNPVEDVSLTGEPMSYLGKLAREAIRFH
jgi:hypothetical protein